MQPVTGTRPQMLTFALLCWSLLLLDRHLRRGGRGIWLLIPLVVLWANLHAGFAVGLGILVAALAAALLDARWRHQFDAVQRRRLATAAAALCVCAVAALINPNGIDLYRYALLGSTPAAHQLIQEWQRPDFTTAEMLPLALLIVATALSMALGRRRLRPSQVVLALIGVVAALIAVRNIAIAVALLSPALAELLSIRYRLPSRRVALPAIALAAGAAITMTAIVRLSQDTQDSAIAGKFPVCLLSDLQATRQPVQLWLPYAQSGYAINQAWPQVHVYVYGNDAALGAGVIVDYVRVASGTVASPSALQLLRDSHTDAVITSAGRLATELQGAGWRSVAQANSQTLFAAPSFTAVTAVPCAGG
jgi:hypothetical protein